MEDERSAKDSEVMQSGYDFSQFDEVQKRALAYLLRINKPDQNKWLKGYLKELLLKFSDFGKSEGQPTKPIWEEEKAAMKVGKRPRGSSNFEFDDEEDNERATKMRAYVNLMIQKRIPAEFEKRIENSFLPAEFEKRIENSHCPAVAVEERRRKMEDEWSLYDSEVMESGYDYLKYKEVLKQSKEYLRVLNPPKRLEIIRELLKNPNFDDTDVYYLAMIETPDRSYKPKSPTKIRFVMSGRQPSKSIWEEEKAVMKAGKMGRKRPRGSSDCEFDDEEDRDRKNKKKGGNNLSQKMMNVNNIDLPEITPNLPAEFEKLIKNQGGTQVTLVMQKKLTHTDVSTGHTRLSLPPGNLIDKDFLSGEEKAFEQNGKGVPKMAAQLITQDGKVHMVDLRPWNMTRKIYNVVKGWNDVVVAHGLRAEQMVQLWSFRVEGKLWFALVKL